MGLFHSFVIPDDTIKKGGKAFGFFIRQHGICELLKAMGMLSHSLDLTTNLDYKLSNLWSIQEPSDKKTSNFTYCMSISLFYKLATT